jgi:Uma2 family endonuclease
LLIEVSDTTTAYDRTVKVPLYARAGIRETWLIDLSAGVVEVYRGPGSAGYKSKESFFAGDVLSIEAMPEVRLAVDAMIGPQQGAG